MTTELLLVRHGRTDWNDEGRYQGQQGPGLNKQGRAQAQATAKQLAREGIDALYASDLARALETAHIIASRLDLPVQADTRLRELHQGVWQGMLFDDIQARYAEELAAFRNDPVHNGPPGGETLAQLTRRFTEALDDIAARHAGRRVVIVTHKIPIAITRCMVIGRLPSQVWDAIPNNAQVVSVTWPVDRLATEAWLASGY